MNRRVVITGMGVVSSVGNNIDNPEEYDIDKATARKSDRFCLFALAAANQAVKDSNIIGKKSTY